MRLGTADVDGLLESISSQQLTEWMAYHNLEPFGDELVDIHLATITSILVNQNRKKGEAARPADDFRVWKMPKPSSAENLWERLKNWAVMAGKPTTD